MILCPTCLHKEMVGALFCSECGTQLIFNEGIPTTTIESSTLLTEDSPKENITQYPQASVASKQTKISLTLNILSNGQVINVGDKPKVTLGRISEGQPVIPDIDLTPYKAYEAGVSRMHASIKMNGPRITVTDLGSANGTRINGKKITAHTAYPINNGDILTLGKFKIQVLI